MGRSVRAAVMASLAAPTLLLTGCERPVPKITVQAGAFSTTVTPSDYFFDAAHHRSAALDLPTVDVRPDDSVLIDVPHQVVGRGWAVTAISLDTKRTIVGRSGPLSGTHSYRVTAGSNNGAPFIVQVTQLAQGKPDGSVWSFLVKVTDRT